MTHEGMWCVGQPWRGQSGHTSEEQCVVALGLVDAPWQQEMLSCCLMRITGEWQDEVQPLSQENHFALSRCELQMLRGYRELAFT